MDPAACSSKEHNLSGSTMTRAWQHWRHFQHACLALLSTLSEVYAHWTHRQGPFRGSLLQSLNEHPDPGLLAPCPLLLSPLQLPPQLWVRIRLEQKGGVYML